MNERHGHYWCETCDEPSFGPRCQHGRRHVVKFIVDQPMRSWESTRKPEPVSEERGRELFEQMFATLKQKETEQ